MACAMCDEDHYVETQRSPIPSRLDLRLEEIEIQQPTSSRIVVRATKHLVFNKARTNCPSRKPSNAGDSRSSRGRLC